jgi:hypothetical protein
MQINNNKQDNKHLNHTKIIIYYFVYYLHHYSQVTIQIIFY